MSGSGHEGGQRQYDSSPSGYKPKALPPLAMQPKKNDYASAIEQSKAPISGAPNSIKQFQQMQVQN